MKAAIPILLFYLTALSVRSEDWHSIYNDSQRSWMERWSYLASHSDEMPPETRIEILSHLLGNENNPNYTPEQIEVAVRITGILLDTPGHAEHFGKQIDAAFEGMFSLDENGERIGVPGWGHFFEVRMRNLQILEMLPSIETVRVLGEMLDNDYAPESSSEYVGPHNSLDKLAGASLSRLGIANAPTPPSAHSGETEANLPAWKQWYAEVKEGRRTFGFIGDPVDYDLRGPSKRGEVVPTERGPKRNAETPQGKTTPVRTEKTSKGDLPYIFGGLFLLAGIILYLRGRKNGD